MNLAPSRASPKKKRARPASPRVAERRGRRLVLYLALCVGGAVALMPFVWLVRSSLMSVGQIFSFPPRWLPHPFEWSNYSGALTVVPFGRYFLNTAIIEVFAVAGTVLTCSLAAFSFARLRWPGRNLVFGIMLTSLMLPYAATLIPTFIMWEHLGLVNTFYPLTVPSWFGGAAGGMFSTFLLRQFFLTIPTELDDAAYVDGASPLEVYWRVIIPLSKPALVVVAVFQFVFVWNDFLNPLIYLSDSDKFTVSLGLAAFLGNHTTQWGYLMAASTVVTGPVILLFFFAQRYFIQGITLTGLKG